MKKSKVKSIKPVRGWAVICPDSGYMWAFERRYIAKEAKSMHDKQGHGIHKIIPVLISPLKARKERKE